MAFTATLGGTNISDNVTLFLTRATAWNGVDLLTNTVEYSGTRAGGVITSRRAGTFSIDLEWVVKAGSFAAIEAAIASLKLTLAPARQRLVVSATDTRFWIVTQTGHVEADITSPVGGSAVVRATVIAEQPYAQALTPTTNVQTGALVTTFDPTVVTGTSTYSALVIGAAPALYYRFGEAVGATQPKDSSGHGLTGSVTGTPTFAAAGAISGDTNTAVTLASASSQRLQTAGTYAALAFGDTFSAELWFKRATTGVQQGLITLDDAGNGTTYGWELFLTSGNNVRLQRRDVSVICTSTATYANTNWHHAMITKAAGTVKLYVDNVDVTGTVTNFTINKGEEESARAQAYFGYKLAGTSYFNGTIDEGALYATALTAAQVNDRWQAGAATATSRHVSAVTLTPGGEAPAPVRVWVAHQAGSPTVPSAIDLINASGGISPWPKLRTALSLAVGSVVLLDGATEQVITAPNTSITALYPFADAMAEVLDFSGNSRDLSRLVPTIMEDVPAGFWRLSEASGTSATDLSGNARTGTYAITAVASAAPLDNDATAGSTFNGTTQRITVPSVTAFNTLDGDFTLELWCNPTNFSAIRSLFGSSANNGAGLSVDTAGKLRLDKINVTNAAVSTTALTAGVNQHVAVTYKLSTTTYVYYLNGVAVGTGTFSASGFTGYTNLIGDYSASNGLFLGTLSNAAITRSTLTAARILAHYQAGVMASDGVLFAQDSQTGAALVFDGVAGTVASADAVGAALGFTADFTVNFPFKPASIGTAQALVGKAGTNAGWYVGITAGGLLIAEVGNGTTVRTATGTTVLVVGTEYVATLTFTQATGTLKLSLGGQQEAQTGTTVFTPSAAGNSFSVLASYTTANALQYFSGSIGELLAYTVALPQTSTTSLATVATLARQGAMAAIGTKASPSGLFPDLDPVAGATNRHEVGFTAVSATPPTVRIARIFRTRYR